MYVHICMRILYVRICICIHTYRSQYKPTYAIHKHIHTKIRRYTQRYVYACK